ncbi:MAG: helix-turn-helix transcriptional regulator [Ginsengibacter sp.]
MKIYIRNMVSIRCKLIVKAELEKLGMHCIAIELGEVEIKEDVSKEQYNRLNIALQRTGLELLDDNKSIMVEKTRNLVVQMVHYSKELPKINISDYISERLGYNYTYVSRLFSAVRGTSLSHYFIVQKIERAKELITYGELTITEIAFKLHYSSVAHLSNQFKKITGLTPSHFKRMKDKRKKRIPLGLV